MAHRPLSLVVMVTKLKTGLWWRKDSHRREKTLFSTIAIRILAQLFLITRGSSQTRVKSRTTVR
jgi:hypothetical protein